MTNTSPLGDTPVTAIFFDFDGVILDSVLLKEQVFRDMVAREWPEHLEACMEYFLSHGGTSRIQKFRWIWTNILGREMDESAIDGLGREFSERVYEQVVKCAYIPGADRFLDAFSDRVPSFVISGTPEPELRGIVRDRGMAVFFRGVYGSPPTKVQIGERILAEQGYSRDGVWFIGDATTDRDAARALGVRFVGISGPHLSPYVDGNEIMIDDLRQLAGVLGLA
ncbi:MAG: HAD hydrolase-like protein [Planctomycetota bacterium]